MSISSPFASDREYNEYLAEIAREREYEEAMRRQRIIQDRQNGHSARQHSIDYRDSDNHDYYD